MASRYNIYSKNCILQIFGSSKANEKYHSNMIRMPIKINAKKPNVSNIAG